MPLEYLGITNIVIDRVIGLVCPGSQWCKQMPGSKAGDGREVLLGLAVNTYFYGLA